MIQKIEEDLTYNELLSSEDNLWSMLYLTGYLTPVRQTELNCSLPEGCLGLKIPNREIKEIFETTVSKWFQESTQKWNRKALFEAVWTGNAETVTKEMTRLLRKTISYYDYREDFYHAFLPVYLPVQGMLWNRTENMEKGAAILLYRTILGIVWRFLKLSMQDLKKDWKRLVMRRLHR